MSKLSATYAQALYDLGVQEGLCETLQEQLTALDGIFRQQPEYLRLLSAPNVPKKERCDLLQQSVGASVHPYVLNFLKILTEKGYIRQFSACCKDFSKLYDEAHGILAVQAVTAVPLDAVRQEKLTKKLESITGKIIRLENKIDPKCLGGVRLLYDGKLVDGTVAGNLDAIRSTLMHTVL